MQTITEQNEYITDWLHDRLGYEISECVTIAQTRNGHIEAVAAFHQYRPEDGTIELSFASNTPKWQSRRYLRDLFRYPFEQLGCIRVTTYAPAANSKAVSLNERIGFVREGVLRRAHQGGDLVVFGMLRDECRWINGQKQTQSAPGSRSSSDRASTGGS
jgi:RimJ/RimL family protein N-acetyltransferase